ncbi:MAG: M24 family metallopeptidase [Planktomarina sp.]
MQRTQHLQAQMERAQVDSVVLTTEPNVRYYSGFLTQFWQSPTRPWFLIVPAEGEPMAVIPSIGEASIKSSHVGKVHVWASPRPEDEGVSMLASVLKDVCKGHKKVGVPMGPETLVRMPANDFAALRDQLTGIEVVDCTDILIALRTIKSESEIAKQAYVASLVSDAYANVPNIVSAGMSERDVVRAYRADVLGRGADTVPYIVSTAAAGGSDDAIRFPTDRAMEDGDVLFIDTGAEIDGYYCDFDRNFALGHADDAAKRAYELVYRANNAGIAAVKPGARACDVFNAMAAVLEDGGATVGCVGRMGHGIGLHNTEWPSLMATDQTVLQPGMVLAVEPGFDFAPGKMMLHEENVVVREHGAELITRRAAAELPVI